MEAHNLIRLNKIVFGYNGKPLLFNGLDFSLTKGGRLGITGSNGCGKTTLFNIIMGFTKPLSGTIEIAGELIKSESDFQKVRMNIGFLFQNSDDQLFCPTVREEVAFGPLNLRIPRDEVEKRIRESLNLVGLQGFEECAPYHLSEGEKKRLAIATILAMKPKILLLDEPTNGLDNLGVKSIIEILNHNDFGYVVISQDFDFLRKVTNIIYTIDNGTLKEFSLH
ncbi:MAG: energy-coupling factor ABC transporter ATP-binding protein [bacterium]